MDNLANTKYGSVIRLYDDSPLATEFSAKVTGCEPTCDGRFAVTLDRTAFFPEGGGQMSDSGALNGVALFGLYESNGNIYHISSRAYEIGQEVTGRLDKDERLHRMSSHTGEHIISSIIEANYGYRNVGFHIGKDEVTADFDGELSHAQVSFIEREANFAIRENLPVTVSYPSRGELASLKYRSKLELTSNVRIVSIGDIDKCACCAPHVPFTGYIGSLIISDCKRYKGGVRMTLKAGAEALDFSRQNIDILSDIASSLSTGILGVASAFETQLEVGRAQKQSMDLLNEKINKLTLDTLKSEGKPIFLYDERDDREAQRRLALMISEEKGVPALILGADRRFTLIAKDGVRAKFAVLKEKTGCQGGGSDAMATGFLPQSCEISALKATFEEIF